MTESLFVIVLEFLLEHLSESLTYFKYDDVFVTDYEIDIEFEPPT